MPLRNAIFIETEAVSKPGRSFSSNVECPVILRSLDQVGAAEHLPQSRIRVTSVPAIEAVQEFRLLERATRHGTRNAVQAFAEPHPGRSHLVLGS
jgi:hypothetical protein